MMWLQGETEYYFACDGIGGEECERLDGVAIAEARRDSPKQPAHVSDFAVCWMYAQRLGWKSFKQTGKPWRYFCANCAPKAEEEQRRWNQQEHERERLKERNARYE